ncbi:hypothetical protein ACFL3V_01165 [Nanoarchaeota archaeon]
MPDNLEIRLNLDVHHQNNNSGYGQITRSICNDDRPKYLFKTFEQVITGLVHNRDDCTEEEQGLLSLVDGLMKYDRLTKQDNPSNRLAIMLYDEENNPIRDEPFHLEDFVTSRKDPDRGLINMGVGLYGNQQYQAPMQEPEDSPEISMQERSKDRRLPKILHKVLQAAVAVSLIAHTFYPSCESLYPKTAENKAAAETPVKPPYPKKVAAVDNTKIDYELDRIASLAEDYHPIIKKPTKRIRARPKKRRQRRRKYNEPNPFLRKLNGTNYIWISASQPGEYTSHNPNQNHKGKYSRTIGGL